MTISETRKESFRTLSTVSNGGNVQRYHLHNLIAQNFSFQLSFFFFFIYFKEVLRTEFELNEISESLSK